MNCIITNRGCLSVQLKLKHGQIFGFHVDDSLGFRYNCFFVRSGHL